MGNYHYEEEDEGDFGGELSATLSDGDCVLCLQPITNPMGEKCYLKHLEMWLVSQGMNEIESGIVGDHVEKRLPRNNPNRELCVTCGKEYLSVCSYCFVFVASEVLRKLSFARNFEEDFEYMFSYKGGDLE